MTLSKEDFDQIRRIVREELELESENIRSEIGSSLTMTKIQILDDIHGLTNWIKNLLLETKRIKPDFEED